MTCMGWAVWDRVSFTKAQTHLRHKLEDTQVRLLQHADSSDTHNVGVLQAKLNLGLVTKFSALSII